MRKVRLEYWQVFPLVGITPAYAGSTSRNRSGVSASRDHPRVCGKYYFRQFTTVMSLGSPPRMREVLYSDTDSIKFTKDHPRVCGKYKLQGSQQRRAEGSPPRMREVPSPELTARLYGGITPAYAGSTPKTCLLYTSRCV